VHEFGFDIFAAGIKLVVLGVLGSGEILVLGHGAVSLFFFFLRNTMQFG